MGRNQLESFMMVPGTRPKEPKQGGENGGREYGAEKKGVCL